MKKRLLCLILPVITLILEILPYGGTDTSSMQLSGAGSRAGALSIPSRYIHSGVEVCDLNDAKSCADLAVAFAETL